MEVHHSFLHQNNSTVNHVTWFMAHASQFLCWNRAVFCACKKLEPEKYLYEIDRHTCKFLVQDDLYQFQVQVSRACVADIGLSTLVPVHGVFSWRDSVN